MKLKNLNDMKTIEKLAKKDSTNAVTKKDGTLKEFAKAAIRFYGNSEKERKFRTSYTSGSYRFTTILHNNSVKDICRLFGYKFEEGNDAPKGGQTGNYIKVSKAAWKSIKSLID
jgi:hypothetical protein